MASTSVQNDYTNADPDRRHQRRPSLTTPMLAQTDDTNAGPEHLSSSHPVAGSDVMEEGKDDSLGRYVTGNVRNTIYGPAKFLPKRLRRYRVKNHDEYILYRKKVEESGGFDVDGCTGSLPGGISPAGPTSSWWELADLAAQFAALKQAEDGGTKLEYKQLVKVNVQAVAGAMYYLTFTAIDTTDQIEKIYRAKVWAKPETEVELYLVSFDTFTNSEKTAEEMRLEITTLLDKLGKRVGPTPSLDPNKFPNLNIKPRPGEFAAKGFLIFLNKIRSENPSWKYATVRRVASRKWRSLHDLEKSIYEMKAKDQFMEKRYGEEWCPNRKRLW